MVWYTTMQLRLSVAIQMRNKQGNFLHLKHGGVAQWLEQLAHN